MLVKLRTRVIKLTQRIHPRLFFCVVGSFYGILMLLITPPFQVPDGFNHFYKAYQVSTGELLPYAENNRLGAHVPRSFVQFANSFSTIPWYPSSKTNLKKITEQFSLELNEDDKVFVDFPNTALYSPVSYIPQSIAVFVFRKLGFSPALIFYLTRLFVLVIWIFSFSLVIKIVPTHKWLFVFLGLLPMSVFINMSFSADMVTNILSFILIVLILKVNFSAKRHSIRTFWLIFITVILLASAKLVYIPLAFLFLIIPSAGFRDKKQQIIQTSILFIGGFGTALLWATIANSYYLPYENYNPVFRDGITLMPCADPAKQVEYIFNNGFYIVEVFVNSMIASFEMYFKGYIGTFGWLDAQLPFGLVVATYTILFSQLFFSKELSFNFSTFQRLILISIVLIVIALLLLTMHLSWDCVGDKIIGTIQGRYLSPVFPLLFVVISDIKIKMKSNINPMSALFLIFILTYSIYTLLIRYYY